MGSVTTHNPNSDINNTGVQDKWSRPILHVSIIILFCILTYSNTLHNGFHLDDGLHILYNPAIETVSPMSRHFVDPSTFSDPRSWIGLVFVLSTLFIAWRFRAKNPLIPFCILAYWIIFSPSSSVVPLLQMEFDYRAYPSSVFLYLILAVTAFQLLRPFILTLGLLVVLAYLSLAAHYFNQVWKNGLTLWGHSVA